MLLQEGMCVLGRQQLLGEDHSNGSCGCAESIVVYGADGRQAPGEVCRQGLGALAR